MTDIDQPGVKEILWHKMRADLKSLVPWFADNELLLCPTCLRPLKLDDFSTDCTDDYQLLVRLSSGPDETSAVSVGQIRHDPTHITNAIERWKFNYTMTVQGFDDFIKNCSGIVSTGEMNAIKNVRKLYIDFANNNKLTMERILGRSIELPTGAQP